MTWAASARSPRPARRALVPPGDAAALREEIARLLADPPARERLAVAARALANGEWSWERVATRTRALYASLLS